jgi:hypothetical protein
LQIILKSATAKIGCRFVIADFLVTDLSIADLAATDNPLLILATDKSVASFVNQ